MKQTDIHEKIVGQVVGKMNLVDIKLYPDKDGTVEAVLLKYVDLNYGKETIQDMTQEEIKKYQKEHPIYYQRCPFLYTKCPVKYEWLKCSSKRYGMCCRTCANYNPLRMLYEKELKPGNILGVPLQVLLADAKIQLGHENLKFSGGRYGNIKLHDNG